MRQPSLDHAEGGDLSKVLTENSSNLNAASSQSGNDWLTWITRGLKHAGLKALELFHNIVQGDGTPPQQMLEHIEAGGMPKFLIKKTLNMSGTMRDLPCLGRGEVVMWVKYWKGAGLFRATLPVVTLDQITS